MYKRFLPLAFLISSTSFASSDLEKALSAYQQQDIDAAYIYLKNALQENDENLTAKILMGRVLLAKGLYRDGIREFEDALALGADPNQFIFEQVRAMLLVGRYQALIDLLATLNLNKDIKVKTLLITSNAYIAMEKEAQALEPLIQAKALAPKDISVLSSLTNYYINQRAFEQAEQLLKELLILAADNGKVWNLYADFYATQGYHKKALASLEKAYTLDPQDPVVMRSLAHKYTDMRMHDKALALVNTIIELTPNDPYARLLKSQLLTQSNQLEEAQQMLQDISSKLSLLTDTQKNSNTSLAYVAGAAAFMQGNLEQAQKELIFYVNNNPNDLSGLNMLTAIYAQLGQQGKIQELLERHEKIVLRDLGLSLKLFNVYLQGNKIYKAKNILDDLADTYPNNMQIILAKANYLAQAKRFKEAITLLNEQQPTPVSASYLLTKGLIYMEMGNYAQATAIADELLKVGPNNTSFKNFKGVILLRSGQWQKAAAIFEEILTQTPQAYTPKFNLANAFARQGKFNESLSLVNSLVEQGYRQSELLLLKTKLLRDTGQTSEALATLESVLKNNGRNVSAISLLMELQYQAGNYQQALELVNDLNNVVFLEPNYLVYHANILIKLGRFEEAQKPLGVLLGLAKSSDNFYQLSLLYSQSGNDLKAYDVIEQAIAKAPSSQLYQLTRARLALSVKPIAEASTLIADLGKRYPNNANVYLLKGDLNNQKGQLSDAHKNYVKALKLDNNFEQAAVKLYQLASNDIGAKVFSQLLEKIVAKQQSSPLMQNLLADYYLNIGQHQKAKAHYEQLIDVDGPNSANILNNLANIYIDIDLKRAKALIEQAIDLRPNTSAYLDTHGWILTKQGQFNEALTMLRKAYALNSSDPAISYHLGVALHKLDRQAEAKLELNRAISSNNDFPDKDAAAKLLKQLSK